MAGEPGGRWTKDEIGIGRRIGAITINIVVLVLLLIVFGVLFHQAHSADGSASVNLTGVSAVIWFVLALAFLAIPKLLMGQTIGRWCLGGRPSRR